MADLSSLAVQLQMFLKVEGHYKKGPLDGIVGPQMRSAMSAILTEYKIPHAKWTWGRRLIGVQQLYFKSLKLYSGPIDGWDGSLTDYAKEQWAAKKVTTWRDTVEETIKAVPGTVASPVKAPTTPPAAKTRWPTQSGCGSFYGGVGTNQATAIMPYEMCLAWDTKSKVTKFSCHKKVKEPIERIFGRTLDHYGYEKIKELRLHYWGGCLNVRRMRGGSSWSMHAWGIAVDMDPDRNQLKWGRDRAVFAKPEYKKFWEFVYDEGAISLGIERNYDWMHFQFARL